jgi:hypothetical protein
VVDIDLNNMEIKTKKEIKTDSYRTDIQSQKFMFTRVKKDLTFPIIMSDMDKKIGQSNLISITDGETKKVFQTENIPELAAVGNFSSYFQDITFIKYHNIVEYFDIIDSDFNYVGALGQNIFETVNALETDPASSYFYFTGMLRNQQGWGVLRFQPGKSFGKNSKLTDENSFDKRLIVFNEKLGIDDYTTIGKLIPNEKTHQSYVVFHNISTNIEFESTDTLIFYRLTNDFRIQGKLTLNLVII